MKTTSNPTFKRFLISFILFGLILGGPPSAAAEIQRVAVAVVPFKINAEKDLSFLRDGIVEMLASRLFWEDRVGVLTRDDTAKVHENVQAPLNESKARQIGTRLKVDYVLFGSLTVFGNSVSIDAKMIALKEDRPPVSVYDQTKGRSEVIPRTNDFAQDINNQIFGRGPTAVAAAPSQPRFSKAHPETIMSGPAPSTPAPQGGSSFVQLQSGREASSDIFKSQKLSFPVLGMDVGDLDGDGVGDNADAFPADPNEDTDTDSDGVGDNADAFPSDPNETADTDSDGVGDNADAFPNDPTETVDTDGDGVGDNGDAFPGDPNESADSDGDGTGDNSEPDEANPCIPSTTVAAGDTEAEGTPEGRDASTAAPD